MSVRKTTFEERLDLHGSALDEPTPVLCLRPHKEGNSAPDRGVGRGQTEFPEGEKNLTGGVGVTA